MQIAMERRKTIIVVGLFLALFMLLGFVAPKHADATTSSERHMAWLINKARASYDRNALRLNDSLSNYARKHSRAMAAKNRLYHNTQLASWLDDWSWRILGENVGVGGTTYSLHKAFMASPGHKRNNLDRRFKNVGVGIVSSRGRLWVTVIFRG